MPASTHPFPQETFGQRHNAGVIAQEPALVLEYDRIRALIAEGRRRASVAINFATVETYWQVGREIVEEEQGGKDPLQPEDILIDPYIPDLLGLKTYLKLSFTPDDRDQVEQWLPFGGGDGL